MKEIDGMKILLVEDEEKLADVLRRGLTLEGHTVDTISDGQKALTRMSLHRDDYDAVILDLMLPSMGGDEVCAESRARGVTTPILILTARSETDTKVRVLLAGADDYVVKPFSFAELSARLKALNRRPYETVVEKLHIGDIVLDPNMRSVTLGGDDVQLTLKEFSLLEYFMRHPNTVVNREDLLSHLWDFNYAGFSNVVDVHVKNLRKKLGDDGGRVLETVRGVGYRLRA